MRTDSREAAGAVASTPAAHVRLAPDEAHPLLAQLVAERIEIENAAGKQDDRQQVHRENAVRQGQLPEPVWRAAYSSWNL